MINKKVLICGDSFASDWSVKTQTSNVGWPNLLQNMYDVTNLAQAGCSEYKIYQQLVSTMLSSYDHIIIFHTSPFRIYVKQHPYLSNDILHHDCDLIYNDIKNHVFPDQEAIVTFFEKYFDLDYAKFVHNLICEKIDVITDGMSCLHLSVNDDPDHYVFKNYIDVSTTFKQHRGDVNHLDNLGNKIISEKVVTWLNR
jgi:hypothetical protein